ncbi:hypothetical protein HY490_01385, partial [Candidatus Woesearchaeota archaeon]|nr:hypothetical protein [Candidatus Woesearchaeota archaeon]
MGEAETSTERMKLLSQKQANIRNIATSAHIHHGKCVAPHTRLLLTDGSVISAEQLYERASHVGKKARDNADETIYDISEQNIEVFSLNKQTGSIEKKNISHAWKLAGGEVIAATLRNGAKISTTPEHKYIVLHDMDFVEKEASELKLGDRVVCARKLDYKHTANLQKEILTRLQNTPCYVTLANEFGKDLKDKILEHGTKVMCRKLGIAIATKSFYHGAWQNRYALSHLLKLAPVFDISLQEVYSNIVTLSFRPATKSTKEMRLPRAFEDLFYLTGLFFGDGSAHKFVVGKQELKDKVLEICQSLGIQARYVQNKQRTPEIHTNECLHYFLNAIFGYPLKNKSHTIRINDLLFTSPSEMIAQFVKGYFDTDGCVEQSRRAISVSSVSRGMLKDLQLLLLRFGCQGIVQDDTLYISGLSAKNFLDKIGFGLSGKAQRAKELVSRVQGSNVVDVIPLSNEKLVAVRKVPQATIDHHYYKYETGILTPTVSTVLELKQQFADHQLSTHWFDKLTTGDLAFIEVIALARENEPIVYDFSVPDHRNFIAEGMVIHNTAFTDNLLAAAGLMSEKNAGDLDTGMMTWQH